MARKLANTFTMLPQEATIISCTSINGAYMLNISFPEGERICPHCGCVRCIIKDSGREQTVRHVSNGIHPVFLTFHKKRYLCKSCGQSFYQHPYWLHPSLRMTMDLYYKLRLDLSEMLSVSQIAAINHVTNDTVLGVLDSIDMPRPERLPETLCCDEFKGDSGIWDASAKKRKKLKYQCSIASGDSGYITDILPEINAGYLSAYFASYTPHERSRVRYFCCDMHNGYTGIASRFFPNAVICIDLFHVINRLNKAVNDVRIRLQNGCMDSGDTLNYKKLKNSRYILLIRESNQHKSWGGHYDHNSQRLEDALSVSDDLRTVYDAAQNFHIICSEKEYTVKRTLLTVWIRDNIHSEVPELASAVRTIQHWRGYIQNGWKYNRSNGPIEGLNNKIKVLKRVSFGVHDFSAFRKRILLTCGPYHASRDAMSITGLKHEIMKKGLSRPLSKHPAYLFTYLLHKDMVHFFTYYERY